MRKDTSNPRKYHHITKEDRDIIAVRLAEEKSDTEIGKEIGRHRSTIWREKKRNKPMIRNVRYLAHRAHERAIERWKTSHFRERLANKRLRSLVTTRISKEYSPEQVVGDLAIKKPELGINHESIYQYIYHDARELIPKLRKHHRNRRKRGSGKNKRAAKVQNRTMIDKRPKAAGKKIQFGHWEGDNMISRASKASLLVLKELKSQRIILKRLEAKTAENMRKGLTKTLCKMPSKMLRTLTLDNGTENAEHEHVSDVLGIDVYFCNPYHSWEKGSVENIIGLIREYLPKGTDLGKLTKKQIKWIERRLNNRPRKCLGYQTPEKVFRQAVALAA